MILLDNTRDRIISATFKGVRQYGLDGVRIQNIAELASLSPGAVYRYFESKEQLMIDCFSHIDQQVARIFENLTLDPKLVVQEPIKAVWQLWHPYFQYWLHRPDETVFYHRFRDSNLFPIYDQRRDDNYFKSFIGIINTFIDKFPHLKDLSWKLLWLHLRTTTVMHARYVVEGVLTNTEKTERQVFQLLTSGLSEYLRP